MMARLWAASQQPLGESIGPADLSDDLTNPTVRMRLARDLKRQGKHAEALEHFLWCFDEGQNHSKSFGGVRLSFLLADIRDLGEIYPPAREALEARRDAAEARILTGTGNPAAGLELTSLNKHLNEPDRSVAFLDSLPAEHAARGPMVSTVMDQLLSARRYRDIVDALHVEELVDQSLLRLKETSARNEALDKQALQEVSDDAHAAIRRIALRRGAEGFEALAGAAHTDRAIALLDKLLQTDASPETRGLLLKHAERSGNADVIAYLRSAMLDQ
jgi:hypothetical protein